MPRFDLSKLNPQQREAVCHIHGPMLILAGAGTGKTRVITARIAYLIREKIEPRRILAVTFTNKAANEMRERVAGMVSAEAAKKITIGTFHALCLRILREDIERLGYKRNFSIYDESDQLSLLRRIITRTAAKDEKLEPKAAKAAISRAKNNSWNPPEDGDTLLGAVYARYEQALKELNAVDFDDLLRLAVRLLDRHNEVREKWQRRFQQVLVDEFQDTNRLQLDLVAQLVARHRNICVVGDDDQSIYSWRGAETANLLEFEAHFPNPRIVRLEQNYRSTSRILRLANGLIRKNPRRREKRLWSSLGEGEAVRLMNPADERTEAEFVANEIYERKHSGSGRWEDFAVLYRMNAQSRLLEERLREQRIPYRMIGGKSFYDRREVKDLLAYTSLLLNPNDDVALLRIINTPPRGIGANLVQEALQTSIERQTSLFSILSDSDYQRSLKTKARQALERFVEKTRAWKSEAQTRLASRILNQILEETGYPAYLRRTSKSENEGLQRETNVREFIESLAQHEKRFGNDPQGFIDRLTLDRDKDEANDNGSGVNLITLHAAKGLEFAHVYLIGLEEGLLPHERSKMEGALDEERRLLYVGITRAMKTLTLTHCATRTRYGNPVSCTPSSFIGELPEEEVDQVDFAAIMNAPPTVESRKRELSRLRDVIGVR